MKLMSTRETRSPNGDLWIEPHSDDKIIQARDNLRYWTDRNKTTFGKCGAEVMNAAQYMISTIDEHYGAVGHLR